ncbi:MFS transporter [Jannaschia ovalis]|uniref:MFS transporter n=1 Tax=Jannaschia ovalis TaxID=3038773 RepID=A0ABY8LGC1_9RHOB|nr:MFS transporter [Jannaschia sp. GRR-S6-38]WGH79443.1 MFS transporter [Jannaschia sp. GRR-S6-38]
MTAPGLPRGLVPLLSAANFVIGMGAFLVIGALGPLGRDLSMSPAQAGWVLTSYALGYALLSPLLVSLTGGLGRRRVLALGMGLFALAAMGSALAPSAGWLFAARVLAAAGAGMCTPVTAAVAGALAPPDRRAHVLAMTLFGLTLAQVLGVPAGSWIAYQAGWRAAFWVVAVLAVLATVALWLRVPAGLSFQPVRLADLARVLAAPRMMLAIGFTATFLGAIYVPYTYLAPLLEQAMGLGRDGVTAALAVYGAGAVVGNLLGGRLADRLGAVRTLVLLSLGQVALMPLISTLPWGLMPALAFFFLWAVSGWSFMAGQQARLVTLAGARAPVVLSLNAAAIYLGAAFGAALGGWVVSGAGLMAVGWAGGLLALGAVAHILASARLAPVDSAPLRP